MIPFVRKMIDINNKHKLQVNQTISTTSMLYAKNEDDIFNVTRNTIVRDLANHILPKLEVDFIKSPIFDDRVLRGQVYVLSKSEFEQMVENIVHETIKEMEPKFNWGDNT